MKLKNSRKIAIYPKRLRNFDISAETLEASEANAVSIVSLLTKPGVDINARYPTADNETLGPAPIDIAKTNAYKYLIKRVGVVDLNQEQSYEPKIIIPKEKPRFKPKFKLKPNAMLNLKQLNKLKIDLIVSSKYQIKK